MESVWKDSVEIQKFNKLDGNKKTDVLIIGGGIAGILCAYMLKRDNVDYILVEADRVCSGITKNTTAKITSQHGLIYNDLINRFGVEYAQMYYEANENAISQFADLCKNIACDFETKPSYVYSRKNPYKIEKEILALEKIGTKKEFVSFLNLPFSVAGAVKFTNQAQFNPLKFCSEIVKGLNIYEHTPVQELIGTKAITPHGQIEAQKIIVATHFPFINKHGSFFLKMFQERSYVLALKNGRDIKGMYIDEAKDGISLRNYGDLLLLGGSNHRTGKKSGAWRELKQIARGYFPDAVEKYRWSTQDCITLDKIPYIGKYSANTENMYVVTGFNKWGMTSSMVGASLLSDLVQGKHNEYTEVFSPSRSILRPQLAVNAFEAVTNLLSPNTKRCPHMGCALKWNKNERSWDCPCHGSRFTEHGKLIDNPATGNLK